MSWAFHLRQLFALQLLFVWLKKTKLLWLQNYASSQRGPLKIAHCKGKVVLSFVVYWIKRETEVGKR